MAGPCLGDWLTQAKPDIQAQMAQYAEENIQFAVLSLARDPLLNLRHALALNIKSILALNVELDKIAPNWGENEAQSDGESPYGNHILKAYGLQQKDIDNLSLSDSEAASTISDGKIPEMTSLCHKLIADQERLRLAIIDEMCLVRQDDLRVTARCSDLGAKIQRFSRLVKRKEQLQQQ